MSVNIDITETNVTACLSGEIDHHSAAMLREEIDRAIESSYPEALILDFGGVTFMDSSGIGLVMGRYKLMQNISGKVIIENAPKSIRKVFKMSGIDKLLTGEKRKEESFV